MQRARMAKLPSIPSLDYNSDAIKLAALCRELQRQQGERPFICPVNKAKEHLQLRWPSQANYLLHLLERERVVECVERGSPNRSGVKGKTTFWRYKLPFDE